MNRTFCVEIRIKICAVRYDSFLFSFNLRLCVGLCCAYPILAPVVMLVGPDNEEVPEDLWIKNHDILNALTTEDIDPILAFYKIVVSNVFEEDEQPDLLQRKREVLHWYLLTGTVSMGAEGPRAF